MGITQLTEHGVKTAKGELVFFMLRPDNLSVLSPEGVRGRVTALTNLLRATPAVRLLALDSRESRANSRTAGVALSRLVRAVTRPRTPSGDSTDRLSGRSIKKTSSPLAVFTPCSVSWVIPMSWRVDWRSRSSFFCFRFKIQIPSIQNTAASKTGSTGRSAGSPGCWRPPGGCSGRRTAPWQSAAAPAPAGPGPRLTG